MKKNIRTEKKRSDDQTAVILEDIRSQFMVFGESLSMISEKVDNLESGQKILSEKVDNLESGQKILTKKVDTVDERLIRIEDNVVEVKHKLSEKVDLEDFQKT
jgi:predicted  nucleic acid-binding Zn-ribbon protein